MLVTRDELVNQFDEIKKLIKKLKPESAKDEEKLEEDGVGATLPIALQLLQPDINQILSEIYVMPLLSSVLSPYYLFNATFTGNNKEELIRKYQPSYCVADEKEYAKLRDERRNLTFSDILNYTLRGFQESIMREQHIGFNKGSVQKAENNAIAAFQIEIEDKLLNNSDNCDELFVALRKTPEKFLAYLVIRVEVLLDKLLSTATSEIPLKHLTDWVTLLEPFSITLLKFAPFGIWFRETREKINGICQDCSIDINEQPEFKLFFAAVHDLKWADADQMIATICRHFKNQKNAHYMFVLLSEYRDIYRAYHALEVIPENAQEMLEASNAKISGSERQLSTKLNAQSASPEISSTVPSRSEKSPRSPVLSATTSTSNPNTSFYEESKTSVTSENSSFSLRQKTNSTFYKKFWLALGICLLVSAFVTLAVFTFGTAVAAGGAAATFASAVASSAATNTVAAGVVGVFSYSFVSSAFICLLLWARSHSKKQIEKVPPLNQQQSVAASAQTPQTDGTRSGQILNKLGAANVPPSERVNQLRSNSESAQASSAASLPIPPAANLATPGMVNHGDELPSQGMRLK